MSTIFLLAEVQGQSLNFNRSQFLEMTDHCYESGEYSILVDNVHPIAMVRLDTRDKDPSNYQVFDCVIKVRTDLMKNKHNDNQDIVVMVFDMNQDSTRCDR